MRSVVKLELRNKRLAVSSNHHQPTTNTRVGRGDSSFLSLPTYTPSSMKGRKAMIQIPLKDGKILLIDEIDVPLINRYRWFAVQRGRGWYAHATVKNADGKWRAALLHRLVTSAPKGFDVDHIDGNSLNNTRANLRVCTRMENCQNAQVKSNSSIGLKGVSQDKKSGRYRAIICNQGKHISLGRFDTAEDAARAYDMAAKQIFGEFARLNFAED